MQKLYKTQNLKYPMLRNYHIVAIRNNAILQQNENKDDDKKPKGFEKFFKKDQEKKPASTKDEEGK